MFLVYMCVLSELKSFRAHIQTPPHTKLRFYLKTLFCFSLRLFLLSRYYICWSDGVLLCACTIRNGEATKKSNQINLIFSIRRQFFCFLFFRQLSVRSTLFSHTLFYYLCLYEKGEQCMLVFLHTHSLFLLILVFLISYCLFFSLFIYFSFFRLAWLCVHMLCLCASFHEHTNHISSLCFVYGLRFGVSHTDPPIYTANNHIWYLLFFIFLQKKNIYISWYTLAQVDECKYTHQQQPQQKKGEKDKM